MYKRRMDDVQNLVEGNSIKNGLLYKNPQLKGIRLSETLLETLVDCGKLYGGRKRSKKTQEVDGKEVEEEVIQWKVTGNQGPFLLVGFDTEYVQKTDIENRVLSYQFHAILPNMDGTVKYEWNGIGYVKDGERITRSQFFGWVYNQGLKQKGIKELPKYAVLVGHYTRADVTAFFDFHEMKEGLMAVRNSFISNNQEAKYNRVELERIAGSKGDNVIYAPLRDTYLLCPSLERSLEKVGDLIDKEKYKKIVIPDNYKKSRMDLYLAGDREGFEKYAIRDAEICAHYALRIVRLHIKEGLSPNVPPTLTGIGVNLLIDFLGKDETQNKYENCFGLEIVDDSRYVAGKEGKPGRAWKTKKTAENKFRYWHHAFISECYHGGRNEQYFFGPAQEGDWRDYDLSGAYPTAMAMIGAPDWKNIKENHDPDYWKKVQATDLAYFYIEFEFPSWVRFPIFTVRTQNGLLFPLKGETYCSAPEIVAARALNCKIKIVRAVYLPSNRNELFLQKFQRKCIANRLLAESEKNSLEAAFWKEISNSSYGKLAQGLKKKRTYNIKENTMVDLPPSKITNPFFAAFTTSFVRAVLGEIMNRLPEDTIVSNCTTDGFLCTANEKAVEEAASGELGQLYRNYRAQVLGKEDISLDECIKVKHRIAQPLGWRTRGQATLKAKDSEPVVLAKAGIKTPREIIGDVEESRYIVHLFKTRTPDSKYKMDVAAGIREMTSELGSDFIIRENARERRLAMEFDWKRKCDESEITLRKITGDDHVYFGTKPWYSVDQFNYCRKRWHEFTKTQQKVIKSIPQLRAFLDYVYLAKKNTRIPRNNGEINTFRLEVCTAFAQGLWGFDKVDKKFRRKEFAEWLSKNGVKAHISNIENHTQREIQNYRFRKTPVLLKLVEAIKKEVTKNFDDSFLWMKEENRKQVEVGDVKYD